MKFLFNIGNKKIAEDKSTAATNLGNNTNANTVIDKSNSSSITSIPNSNVSAEKKQNKLVALIKEHKKLVFFIMLVPISLVLAFLILYYVVLGSNNRSSTQITDAYVLIESKAKTFDLNTFFHSVYLSEVTVRDKQNPLNGSLLTTDQYNALSVYRPLAVITDNQAEARPQSGVSDADLVYELPVEGGISRYLAFYWSNFPVAMGPVRSFRPYFGDIVSEYDALLYHIGQSDIAKADLQSKPELSVYDSATYFSQNSIKHTSCGFYRDQDRINNQIAIEHTAYIDVTKLRSCVAENIYKGLPNITSLKYKADADYSLRSNNSSAKISFDTNFTGTSNTSDWVYDRTNNDYRKVINGKDDIDRNTSTQIRVKNLIIEKVPVTTDYGSAGRLSLNLIGQGSAVFLLDGKVTEGIWQKDNRTARTKYLNTDGSEVEFNRGKTWIAVIGNDSKYQVQ